MQTRNEIGFDQCLTETAVGGNGWLAGGAWRIVLTILIRVHGEIRLCPCHASRLEHQSENSQDHEEFPVSSHSTFPFL